MTAQGGRPKPYRSGNEVETMGDIGTPRQRYDVLPLPEPDTSMLEPADREATPAVVPDGHRRTDRVEPTRPR